MNKLVITRFKGRILSLGLREGQPVQISLESPEEQSILNNIYIGKVKNLVPSIQAAFVDIGKGQMGYYSLADNPCHHFARPQENHKLKPGDEILVQVEREGVKSKAPVLTGNLSFPGRYCVLTSGKCQLGFSAKIKDQAWKQQAKLMLEKEKKDDFGIIVRTGAYGAQPEEIAMELGQLESQYRSLVHDAACRTCFSLLYQAIPPYMANIRDSLSLGIDQVVTDEEEVYQAILSYLQREQPEQAGKLRLYQDALLPLSKLYGVQGVVEGALSKRAWLKSGGYLVIEPTEALVAIDVNTGKYAGKKNQRDTIRKINLEAGAEAARQIRLRNLSGIILIDFIDMEREEDRAELMEALKGHLATDPIRTTLVDMTRLNLVEITRKKVRKPLHEEIGR